MKRQHKTAGDLVPVDVIERRIYLIRRQKVTIDSDLAEMYQVPTKSLNRAVRRNSVRRPGDFMFQLSQQEADSLWFQIETSTASFPEAPHRFPARVKPSPSQQPRAR